MLVGIRKILEYLFIVYSDNMYDITTILELAIVIAGVIVKYNKDKGNK